MPIISPAVKAGIVITMLIIVVSAMLDVFDLVGWGWVDMQL